VTEKIMSAKKKKRLIETANLECKEEEKATAAALKAVKDVVKKRAKKRATKPKDTSAVEGEDQKERSVDRDESRVHFEQIAHAQMISGHVHVDLCTPENSPEKKPLLTPNGDVRSPPPSSFSLCEKGKRRDI
jgi:hypothetical protein